MSGQKHNWRLEKCRTIERFFKAQNLIAGSHSEAVSPSGAFLLAIDRYATGPRTWQYSRGLVTRVSDGKVIADVKRNYGHFLHSWVQHPNGKEYLLCGEDYQGYMVVELSSADVKIHLPCSAENGGGFCWAAIRPSPDGTVLAVQGCIWAAPYDLVFYDFSEPLNLPLVEIGRVEEIGEMIGWESDSIFAVEHEFTVRK